MSPRTTIASDDGLALEAEVDLPSHPGGVVVACHPHPRMGGTMDAPLLLALRDALVGAGWTVVRFNFRGVGASEGEFSGGVSEVADVLGAAAHAHALHPGLPVALVGWSFGAAVAVRAAAGAGAAACVAIAPALSQRPDGTVGVPPAADVDRSMPLLVVCAGNDELFAAGDCRAWGEQAGARTAVIAAANHFFWARYERLTAQVVVFLDDLL